MIWLDRTATPLDELRLEFSVASSAASEAERLATESGSPESIAAHAIAAARAHELAGRVVALEERIRDLLSDCASAIALKKEN